MNSKSSLLLTSLGNIAKDLNSIDTLDSILCYLQNIMKERFDFNTVHLYKFRNNSCSIADLISANGAKKESLSKDHPTVISKNDLMFKRILASELPIYVRDARTDPCTNKDIVNDMGLITILNCQLSIGEVSIGVLGAASYEGEDIREMSSDEILFFGAVANIAAIALDRINQKILSQTDALTNLANKRGLIKSANTFLSLAKRNKQKVAIIYIDLDNFKPLNDKYGHSMGDGILRHFALMLNSFLRETDIKARVGGDEFVLLLSDVKRADCVEQIIEQLNEKCTDFKHKGENIKLTFSAGYSLYPDDSMDFEALIQLADKNMYHVKTNSKSIAS